MPRRSALLASSVAILGLLGCGGRLHGQADRNIARERAPAAGAAEEDAGRKWAVVIGVNDYLDPAVNDLRYCVADAKLLAERLVKLGGYEPERVLLIADDQPKDHLKPYGINLRNQVRQWLIKAREGDTVLVFFSGHGFPDERGQLFLAPKDCEKANPGLTGLRCDDLRDMLRQCKARRKLLVLDCCHAGAAKGDADPGIPADTLNASFRLARGLLTLASCAGQETSKEWDEKGHGLFTYFLAEGLSGAADENRDGLVDSFELYNYTLDRVSTTGQRELGHEQTPTLLGEDLVGRFALARVAGAAAPAEMPRLTGRFTVRVGDASGPLVAGAVVSLLHRAGGGEPTRVAEGRTDREGVAALEAALGPEQQAGNFLVRVEHEGKSREWSLPNFPATTVWSLYVDRPRPSGPAPTITTSIRLELVRIEPGEFVMGTTDAQVDRLLKLFPRLNRGFLVAERPAHRVRIPKAFYLGRHEVTVGQFRAFVEATGYKTDAEEDGKGGSGLVESTGERKLDLKYSWRDPGFRQSEDHPVVNVSYDDALAFCRWLTQKEGGVWRFTLPTEAQWEYACRAGGTTLYPEGDDPEALAEVANVADASLRQRIPAWKSPTIGRDDGHATTAPVGSYRGNRWGLKDMIGNVCEWCLDGYEDEYFKGPPSPAPPGAPGSPLHVSRGGSWDVPPWLCRPALRLKCPPGRVRTCELGFRVAAVQSARASVPEAPPWSEGHGDRVRSRPPDRVGVEGRGAAPPMGLGLGRSGVRDLRPSPRRQPRDPGVRPSPSEAPESSRATSGRPFPAPRRGGRM